MIIRGVMGRGNNKRESRERQRIWCKFYSRGDLNQFNAEPRTSQSRVKFEHVEKLGSEKTEIIQIHEGGVKLIKLIVVGVKEQ